MIKIVFTDYSGWHKKTYSTVATDFTIKTITDTDSFTIKTITDNSSDWSIVGSVARIGDYYLNFNTHITTEL